MNGLAPGALWVGFNHDHLFTNDERAFLLTVANQVGMALDRIEAYAAQQRAWEISEKGAARATLVADIGQILVKTMDQPENLQAIVARVMPMLADLCAMFLVGLDGQLHLAALSQTGEQAVDQLLESAAGELGDWLVSAPYGTQAAFWEPSHPALAPGADFPTFFEPLWTEIKPAAAVLVPMAAHAEIVGAMLFVRMSARPAFGRDDAALLEDIAARVAAAIENARLYNESTRLNIRLEERVKERTAALEAEIEERKMVAQQLDQSKEALRDFSVRLQAAREDEQARLSRELHDELGGAMTGIKMDVAQVRRRLPDDSVELRQRLDNLSAALDDIIQLVRQIATRLRPGILDDFGLPAALEWQAQEFAQRTSIACHLEIAVSERVWGPDESTALFRIFQEALTNVARHSGATVVQARLEEAPLALILNIQDNGRGLTADQSNSGRHSLGLMGIRERALALGGTCVISGSPGHGTTVWVSIPLDDARRSGPQ